MNSKRKIHIIAEIGVNHNGNVTLAKQLMLKAKKYGADSVKFQTYNTDELIIVNTKKQDIRLLILKMMNLNMICLKNMN